MKAESADVKEERINRHKAHHRKIVWMHFVNMFLGVWLMMSPLTFSYQDPAMVLNDQICGFLLILLSGFSAYPSKLWAPWGAAMLGLWLNVAPLIFWAKDAMVYQNDTITGILIIAFAVIAPGSPGSKLYEKAGTGVPPGWSYNPSSWIQRAPIITLGWIGFFASRYLASYQLGYISTAWDPFFDKGTENVLNSDVSKAWPVSDAGLGAFSYMLDAMMGYLGGEKRWRSMPWAVILFGILIIPLGAVSISLIILQPLAVGAWCSICLFTAIAMLIMIPCTFDEMLASIQFLRKSNSEGRSFWKTFWFGDSISAKGGQEEAHDFTRSHSLTLKEIFSDISIPWNLLMCLLSGVWIMLSPFVLGYEDFMADSDHVVGALVVTCSVIAMGEVVRPVRFMNILLGLWMMCFPFLSGSQDPFHIYNGLLFGGLLIIMSFRRGKIIHSYGSFDRYIV